MSDTATHSRGGDFATSRRGGIDADEIGFIADQAAKGRTRQQVARMIGRALEDVLAVWPQAQKPPEAPALKRTEVAVYSPELVLSLWKGLIPRSPKNVTMEMLKWEVARDYGVTIADLEGDCRARWIAIPRQDLMWRAAKTGKWSYPKIGQAIGGRDHSTVIHGKDAHQARLDAAQDQAEAA